MRALVIVKIDPRLRRLEKCPQTLVPIAFSDRELERADKTLGVAIVRGCTSAAHREHKAFLQEQMTGLCSPKLLALVTVPDTARTLKRHRLDRVGDQVRTQMIVKGHAQN